MKPILLPFLLLYSLFSFSQYDITTDFKIQGKVGIGTEFPSEQFQLGDRWTFHNGGTKYIGYNSFWDDGDRRIVEGSASQIRFGSGGDIYFWTAGPGSPNSEINFKRGMIIKHNGNIGFGMPNPLAKIHLPNDEKFRIGPWEIYQEGGGSITSYLRIDRWTSDGTTAWSDKKFAFDWAGRFYAQHVWVLDITEFPDYVFNHDYNLMPLYKLEEYINSKKRLPEVPSAIEVETEGMDLGEMNKLLLKKIEELTLYTIEQHNQINELYEQNNAINSQLKELRNTLSKE